MKTNNDNRNRVSRLQVISQLRVSSFGVPLLVCFLSLSMLCPVNGGLRGVAGYFTPNDSYQHAIVADSAGRVHEVYFNPTVGIFQDVLGCFSQVTAITGFYTPDDQYQHVIVANQDGALYEVYFNPTKGIFEAFLGQFNGVVDIGGFFTPDDGYRHVIVATADGAVTEVYYSPAKGIFQTVIAHYGAIKAVDGFYTPDDQYRHAIVATTDGNVHEVYYNPSVGIFDTVVANFGGIIDVAAFFSSDDNYRHVIVATSDGNLHEVFFNPTTGIGQTVLANLGNILKIGAYFTPTDENRHIIVGLADGSVHEVYFNPKTGVSQDLLANFQSAVPIAQVYSPNASDSAPNGYLSSAGLTVGLGGDLAATYALSLNAGVWKSVNGGPWSQLPGSPRYAFRLAVDPNNTNHVAVGERDGDASNLHANRAGVWESPDAGTTWNYTLDPLTLQGCGSQSISALAFSQAATLFIGTSCGLGRKPTGASSFSFAEAPSGIGWVSALAVSETKVWARTFTKLLVSSDDGLHWTTYSIPPSSGGFNISFDARGDVYSLAAFDGYAFMTFQPNPDTVQNHNTLLIFNAASGAWSTQVLNSGNGTGLGGERFVKSYVLNNSSLLSVVGERLQLVYGGGQTLEKALTQNSDGTLQWGRFAETQGSGDANPDPIHSDVWSFHWAPDGYTAWLSCDGGVWTISPMFEFPSWSSQNQNLQTHHIHTVSLLSRSHSTPSRLVYATSDNDEWHYDAAAGWKTLGCLGDANWTLSDEGNSGIALMISSPGVASMTGFSDKLPNGLPYECGITLNNDDTYDGPLFLHFIQTLPRETGYPLLDAVMLARLPLQYKDSGGKLVNVPGQLGQPNPGGNPVLIRTTQFAANPDANTSQFANWQVVANDLPLKTQGFWVSGGHANPVYYIYTTDITGGHIYKQNSSGVGWQLLNVQNVIVGGGNGPAFINPYDPNQLYVLTKSGISVSADGGASFTLDNVLTRLLTANGKYPLTGGFSGGNDSYVPLSSRANQMATLSAMAFCRDDRKSVVAASPFTGVFYNNGDGSWRDLARYLPRPFTPVATVGIDCEAVYVGTEGRSLLKITDYQNAAVAGLPLRLVLLSQLSPRFFFQLQGDDGARYSIETRNDLGPAGSWTQVANVVLTNAMGTFTWTNSGESSRFFRAVQKP